MNDILFLTQITQPQLVALMLLIFFMAVTITLLITAIINAKLPSRKDRKSHHDLKFWRDISGII
jgi:hypothetical protein